jgi:hypothetical protein
MQVLVNTTDQQGETIARLVAQVKNFGAKNNSDKLEFKLATGNMGVTAATNEAVDKARWEMNFAIFGALLVMCMITFRSLRATLCILIPLAIVSVLCEALMPTLGHRPQGLDAAGDRARRGRGRRLRHLPLRPHRDPPRGRQDLQDGVLRGAERARHRDGVHRGHDDHRRGHLGALRAQVPGRHGDLLAFMFFLNMLGALFLLPALAAFLLKPHHPPKAP